VNDSTHCFELRGFSYVVRVFRLESLQEPKLFNYFYLARYFFGYPARVFFVKRYFILGRTYYNVELGFSLPVSRIQGPLTVWVYQVQPLVNLGLTRDFFLSNVQLQWILKDPSIFSERKTNTGLFYLADPLSFYLNYREVGVPSIFATRKILSALKLILD
jgi:hypothetical protein